MLRNVLNTENFERLNFCSRPVDKKVAGNEEILIEFENTSLKVRLLWTTETNPRTTKSINFH